MKQFNNLLEAINFRTQCPLCQGELQSDSYINSNQKIVIEFLGSSDDIIAIDIVTQKIELAFSDKGLQSKSNCGTLGQPFTMECDDCHMYSFMIQVWIDISNKIITKIILNSERVSWEDESDVLHEIVSGYSTDKTQYSYFGSDVNKDDGQIVLPFIPIDVSNPKEAVARIQKLIVFS